MSAQLIESSPVEPLVVGVHLYPGDTWFREFDVRSVTTQAPVDLSGWVFEARLGEHVGAVDASRAAEGRLAVEFTPEQTADAEWGDAVTVSGMLAGGRRTFLHGVVGAAVGSSIPVGPAQKTRVVSSDVDISVYAAPRGDKGADGSAVSVALVQRAEGAEGRAVAAADDAEGFASSARTDAGLATAAAASADTSADESAESARVALSASQGIVAARDAAAASAADADADADRAGTSAFSAAGSAAAAQSSEDDARGFRDGAKTHRDAAEGFKTAAEAARGGAEQARDVALAGQFAGASLGTVDLDTVTTPGVYRQNNQGNSTVARNYPATGTLGVLTVIQASTDAWMQQEYDPSGFTGQGRVVYRRVRTGGTWQPWRTYASQRVDQTAGRAIYTWDDVNNREQLIYGDTGRRDITSLVTLPSGVTLTSGSKILLQRTMFDVSVWIEEGLESSGAVAQSAILQLPAGFVPVAQGDLSSVLTRNGASIIGAVQTLMDGQLRLGFSAATGTGANTRFRHTFKTVNAWPTSLPGVAVGSVT